MTGQQVVSHAAGADAAVDVDLDGGHVRHGLEREQREEVGEERAELVKHHLWVLWTDYFKPDHLEKYPDLHDKFWKATKQAGECKHHSDPAEGQKLLDMIDDIARIFAETKKA